MARSFFMAGRNQSSLNLYAFALTGLSMVTMAAPVSQAARVTEVADAVDTDDPFDANVEVTLDYTYHRALITREHTQTPAGGGDPRTLLVRELDYSRHTARMLPRLEVGLFRDLSLFFQWPIVVWDQQDMSYTNTTNKSNSTIERDMQSTPTVDGWTEPGQEYGNPGVDREQGHSDWNLQRDGNGVYRKVRVGVDYPTIGGRWSPVNNERDSSKPSIVLQLDYTPAFLLPVKQDVNDPEINNTSTSEISYYVADAAHRFHAMVAISKRFSLLDPYFVADYYFPFSSSDGVMGFDPRHDGGFQLGMEIIPYEHTELEQKLALDFSFLARYFSQGRDYSEVSDAFGELTYTDEFLRTGAQAAIFFKVFRFVSLDLTGTALYDTSHYLTTEQLGCDGGCPDPGLIGFIVNQFESKTIDGQVNPDIDAGERNAFFNPVLDTPGRRLRVEESIYLRIMAHIALTF